MNQHFRDFLRDRTRANLLFYDGGIPFEYEMPVAKEARRVRSKVFLGDLHRKCGQSACLFFLVVDFGDCVDQRRGRRKSAAKQEAEATPTASDETPDIAPARIRGGSRASRQSHAAPAEDATNAGTLYDKILTGYLTIPKVEYSCSYDEKTHEVRRLLLEAVGSWLPRIALSSEHPTLPLRKHFLPLAMTFVSR